MTPPVYRTVIAEDEPEARALLRAMLSAHSQLRVVGEAADGTAAVDMIRSLRPDLVFLDVQMPELSGFDVLQALGRDHTPIVVFVTAYADYALRAFDVRAVDYLLKPFDSERLDRAVENAIERIEARDFAHTRQRFESTLRSLVNGAPPGGRLPLKSDGRIRFVNVADIDWIEVDDHQLRVHAGTEVHFVRETLANMHAQLGSELFLRVHRSTIVNTSRIVEVQPWFDGDFILILRDGKKVTSGRNYREQVRALIRPHSVSP